MQCARPRERGGRQIVPLHFVGRQPEDADVTSVFDVFKIGISPSSSYIMGPMNVGKSFINQPENGGLLTATSHIAVDLYELLSLTGKGHATDAAIIMGLAGNSP